MRDLNMGAWAGMAHAAGDFVTEHRIREQAKKSAAYRSILIVTSTENIDA